MTVGETRITLSYQSQSFETVSSDPPPKKYPQTGACPNKNPLLLSRAMEVVLISPYSDVSAMGLRSLSAVLKKAGHPTRMIFLPYQFPEIEQRSDFITSYSDKILDQVTELCRGAGLIGIGLMTNYFEQVASMTLHLKEALSIPVVWGGIHPTIMPEQCLDYADIVCIGEGEDAILDLVDRLENNRSLEDMPNIWLKKNDTIISNPPRPVIQDLNTIPFNDYDMENHHVLDQATEIISPLNRELLREYLTRSAPTKGRAALFYQTLASRGCPHHCTYCCWDALQRIYPKRQRIRRRSVDNIIEELGIILDRMPWFQEITFSDDSFLDASSTELEEFSRRYKKVAGRSFQCLAEPRTITRKRMDPLVDAGLANIQIGVQSGSKKIQDLYKRNQPNDRVIAMAELLNEYIPRIRPPIYDFILDNPWETLQDKYETLQLLLKLPPPFYVQIFHLTFFPGTELYDLARKDGLISDDIRDVYRQQYNSRDINYINLMYSLFPKPIPRPILRAMCAKPVIKTFQRPIVSGVLDKMYNAYREKVLRKQHKIHNPPVQ